MGSLVPSALPGARTPVATDLTPARTRGHSPATTAPERRARLRAEVGALDTISTALVTELRARVVSDRYHPSARAIAERLLAELTAELLG